MIMNFKEAYKNMENDIHGDRALLHSILNGEATKKKKHEFYFKPVFATALAAVFVICIATIYQHTGIENYSPTGGAGDDINSATSQGLVKDLDDSENISEASVESPVNDAPRFDTDDEEKNSVSEKDSQSEKRKSKTKNRESGTKAVSAGNEKSQDSVSAGSGDAGNDNQNIRGRIGVSGITSETTPDASAAKSKSEQDVKSEIKTDVRSDNVRERESEAAPESRSVTVADTDDKNSPAGSDNESDPIKAMEMAGMFDGSGPNENVVVYDEKATVSGSSGGASSAGQDVISRISVPDDMNFEAEAVCDDDSIIYTAVSEDDPDRQIIIVVSESNDSQKNFPDAHHVQSGDEYISVIAENVTQEELNNVIDSLN